MLRWKVKLPCAGFEGISVRGGTAPLISNLGTRWEWAPPRPGRLNPEERARVPNEQEDWWDPEPAWAVCRREESKWQFFGLLWQEWKVESWIWTWLWTVGEKMCWPTDSVTSINHMCVPCTGWDFQKQQVTLQPTKPHFSDSPCLRFEHYCTAFPTMSVHIQRK